MKIFDKINRGWKGLFEREENILTVRLLIRGSTHHITIDHHKEMDKFLEGVSVIEKNLPALKKVLKTEGYLDRYNVLLEFAPIVYGGKPE